MGMRTTIKSFYNRVSFFIWVFFFLISLQEADLFILPLMRQVPSCHAMYTKEKPWYKTFLNSIHTLMEEGNFQVIKFFLTKSTSEVLFHCSKCLVALEEPIDSQETHKISLNDFWLQDHNHQLGSIELLYQMMYTDLWDAKIVTRTHISGSSHGDGCLLFSQMSSGSDFLPRWNTAVLHQVEENVLSFSHIFVVWAIDRVT